MERKYIIKFNSPNAVGYQVRVPVFEQGLPSYKLGHVSKFFKKKKTWKATLETAIRYRNKLLKEQGYKLSALRVRKNNHVNYKSNTSGLIGVSKTYCLKSNGYYYEAYTATYCIDKKQHKKTFSVLHYGENEAFQEACNVRQKHSGVLIIINRKAIPCLPNVEYIIR